MAARGLVVVAPSSGAGKTTVTLALLRALSRAGASVVGGKSGPDYIDPAFHQMACGRPSLNYDAWAMSDATLRALAAHAPGDLLLIEGAMGALDGAGLAGAGSATDLAHTLGLPLLVVVDACKTGASAVLPVIGLRALRPDVGIAGVALNRVGSDRHAKILTEAFARNAIPVLGTLPRDPAFALPERHLGLVQAREHGDLSDFLDRIADRLSAHADLDAIQQAARPLPPGPSDPRPLPPLGQRIAVATDLAFAFAYPHLLEGWRTQGCEILPFSPLADAPPNPSADAVFLPGGYPELHAGRLAAAQRFRAGMTQAAAAGARIYGECGGYMVLGEGLTDADGTRHPMLGLLAVETSFAARKLHLGYRRLRPRAAAPWSERLCGHEFHYATEISRADAPLFDAEDADGAPLPPMGAARGRISGSFGHVICAAQ